jgi:uncharacterized protein RhaS with RHS repeats
LSVRAERVSLPPAWSDPETTGGILAYIRRLVTAGDIPIQRDSLSLIGRYYDPSTGQFITVDPLVDQTGQPYAYAGGDPVNDSDPDGNGPSPQVVTLGGATALAVILSGPCAFNPGSCNSSNTLVTKKLIDLILHATGKSNSSDAPDVPTDTTPDRDTPPPTNAEAREKAAELGYNEVKDPPFNSHGQLVFKDGGRYISSDVDGHSGDRAWKVFDRSGRRTGTESWDLDKRIGD